MSGALACSLPLLESGEMTRKPSSAAMSGVLWGCSVTMTRNAFSTMSCWTAPFWASSSIHFLSVKRSLCG